MRIEIDPDDLDAASEIYRQQAQRIDNVRSALAGRRGATTLDNRDVTVMRAAPLDACRRAEDRLGQRAQSYRVEAQRLTSTAGRFRSIDGQPWDLGVGSGGGHGWEAIALGALGMGALGMGALTSSVFGFIGGLDGRRAGVGIVRPQQTGRRSLPQELLGSLGRAALWGAGAAVLGPASAWLAANGSSFATSAWNAILSANQATCLGVRSFVEGCVNRCASVLHSGVKAGATVGRWVADAGHSMWSTASSVSKAVLASASHLAGGLDWREVAASVLFAALIPASSDLRSLVGALPGFKTTWPIAFPTTIKDGWGLVGLGKKLTENWSRWENQYGSGWAFTTKAAMTRKLEQGLSKLSWLDRVTTLSGPFVSAISAQEHWTKLRSAHGPGEVLTELSGLADETLGVVAASAKLAGFTARAAGASSLGYSQIGAGLSQAGLLTGLIALNVDAYSHIPQSSRRIDDALAKASVDGFTRLQDYQAKYNTLSALTPADGHHAEFDMITSYNYTMSGLQTIGAGIHAESPGELFGVVGSGAAFIGVGAGKLGVAGVEWAGESTAHHASKLARGAASKLSSGWHSVVDGGLW